MKKYLKKKKNISGKYKFKLNLLIQTQYFLGNTK